MMALLHLDELCKLGVDVTCLWPHGSSLLSASPSRLLDDGEKNLLAPVSRKLVQLLSVKLHTTCPLAQTVPDLAHHCIVPLSPS